MADEQFKVAWNLCQQRFQMQVSTILEAHGADPSQPFDFTSAGLPDGQVAIVFMPIVRLTAVDGVPVAEDDPRQAAVKGS